MSFWKQHIAVIALFGLESTLALPRHANDYGFNNIVVRQDNTTNTTVPTAPQTPPENAICDPDTGLTQDEWNEFNFGPLIVQGASFGPFDRSLMQKFKDDLGGLGSFQCGFDTQCETTGSLLDACPDAPRSSAGLTAMANFNNFFRAVSQKTQNSLSVLSDELPQLTQTFAPAEQSSIEPDDPVGELSFGLTVGGILAGLVPALGQIGAATVIAGATVRKLIAAPGALTPPSNFQAFADVSSTLADTRKGLTDGLKTFVNDRLTTIPADASYSTDEDELPQIMLDGSFAQAITDIPDTFDDSLRQVVTANMINKLWNDKKVIVVKFSVAAFQGEGGESTNPCDPDSKDNIFGEDLKFCDDEGNAFVLQRIPLDPVMDALSTEDQPLNDLSIFDPPGISELGNQGLSIETVTQRAVANQNATGKYLAFPEDDAFADTIASISPSDLTVEDAMLFNFPVCDINSPGLISQQQQGTTCPGRFDGQDVDKCIYTLKVLCGCPSQPLLNGQGWPYATGGDNGPCILV